MIRSPYSKLKTGHFFQIDNDYVKLYAKHLGVMATAVFTSLNMHADAMGVCFPRMELIAEQHGIDRHTVSRALKKLEEWNIISTKRAIDRKLRKRKNNVYEILPKELWRKLPIEDSLSQPVYRLSHGTVDTLHMASRIPNDGTEDTSNKTHLITPIEENSLCGQEPTKTYKENTSPKASSVPAVWNSDQAIQSLIKSGDKDYQIIGTYFYMQQYSFSDRPACVKTLERSLKAAKALRGYKVDDIRKTMEWMNEQEFELGWSLEAVNHYVDDCISTNFMPEGEERGKLLNIINA